MRKIIITLIVAGFVLIFTMCSEEEEEECKICTPHLYDQNDSLLQVMESESAEFCGDELEAKENEENVDPDGNVSRWVCKDY